MLTAILADDHAIVREGLKLLISAIDGVSVIGEAADGDALTKLLRVTHADLLVLDLGMPGVAGIQAIPDIKAAAPRMKILVLTANVEPRTVRAALAAGASGYLTKDGEPEEFADAVAALQRGETYLARTIRFAIGDGSCGEPPPDSRTVVSPIPLTRRERQVLSLIAQGMTARAMAERLGISPLTARKHRENLMGKLNLHSAAELAAYAVRLGLPTG
ncbi:response regulator [Phreatobacter sp. AB_2022a]|uniref:response regulator n=1 Tax=Phreatobacter sp. AB_2022a TaxID=3003134 RepID=UPI002287234E|nr:response regulator transcription factor [Phreatobacter sp. AB_2022a]MCZ0734307.1 response regulator transcription factor [Phreatobacter sp. AB_2022a]